MSEAVAVEHLGPALELEAEKPCDLWEIVLRSGARIYLRDGQTCEWQGHTYEAVSIKLSGEADYSDDQMARPVLALFDRDRSIGPFASQGLLDLATVYRRQVFQSHITADLPIFTQRLWVLGRVVSVANQQLQVELRSPHDMPDHQIPPRMYLPPEFPFVSY